MKIPHGGGEHDDITGTLERSQDQLSLQSAPFKTPAKKQVNEGDEHLEALDPVPLFHGCREDFSAILAHYCPAAVPLPERRSRRQT